jgi:hypothetical protein
VANSGLIQRQYWILVIVAGVSAVLGLCGVFLVVDVVSQPQLILELGKGLIQLVVVVVFGAALKLLADRYQNEQRQAEEERQGRQRQAEQDRQSRQARQERSRLFRQDKYDRLVRATNELRRGPILIDANRTVKTWSRQMLIVIDVGLELRMIKHQIFSSRNVRDLSFPDSADIEALFELMYHYTDFVAEDFANNKEKLEDRQLRVAKSRLSATIRSERQAAVWDAIKELSSVRDMQRGITDPDRVARGDAISDWLRKDTELRRMSEPPREWLTYVEAERLALGLITCATLEPSAG